MSASLPWVEGREVDRPFGLHGPRGYIGRSDRRCLGIFFSLFGRPGIGENNMESRDVKSGWEVERRVGCGVQRAKNA